MTRRELIQRSIRGLSAGALAHVGSACGAWADPASGSSPAGRDSIGAVQGAVQTLERRLTGEVVWPGHPRYEQARKVWNGLADRHPALIVRPADSADVSLAVRFAREYDLPLAIRSGGHSIAGHGTIDDGLLIDLSTMQRLRIDPYRRIARAQSGLTWEQYIAAAQKHELATTSGDVASVGVGGLTLGGGIGWFVRKHGLTIDNLLAVDVVTAEGQLITASAAAHPDLFWALRGGGGNFGIATEFAFRLHPAGTILGGAVFYSAAEALTVVRAAAAYAAQAPDELTIQITLMSAPPAPFIPPSHHGKLAVALFVCCTGDLQEAARIVAPLRRLGSPIADAITPMPYPGMFALTEPATVKGEYHDVRSMYLRTMDDQVVRAIVEGASRGTQVYPRVQIRVLGGAMARVPERSTAFFHRDKPFMCTIFNSTPDRCAFEAQQPWLEEFWQTMQPWADGVYVNFLNDEGQERVREAYGPHYWRLRQLKARYDPDNLFNANQNIKPRPSSAGHAAG
jgi:FAD/FMN-containing dehydrogenase